MFYETFFGLLATRKKLHIRSPYVYILNFYHCTSTHVPFSLNPLYDVSRQLMIFEPTITPVTKLFYINFSNFYCKLLSFADMVELYYKF